MVELQNLKIHYNAKHLLSIAHLIFNPAHITLLLGASGVGKTSLLRCIVGLQNNYSGSINVNNTIHYTANNKIIGYVCQKSILFEHLSLMQNCIQPLILTRGYSNAKASQVIEPLLVYFGLKDQAHQYPKTLSGGQKQRTTLVRTLALAPSVLCLDEPTSALDEHNSTLVVNKLQEYADQGNTVIVCSQDTFFISLLLKSSNTTSLLVQDSTLKKV